MAACSLGLSGRAFWVATTKRCAAPSAPSSRRAWPSKRIRPASTASVECAESTRAGNLRRYFPLRLPVALDARRAVFVYLDPGHETATALRSWGAAHRELWKALWDRGCGIEVVAIVRTPEEDSRAETVLANWARDPRPSEFDHGIGREIDLIDQAIIKGDVPVLMEYGGL